MIKASHGRYPNLQQFIDHPTRTSDATSYCWSFILSLLRSPVLALSWHSCRGKLWAASALGSGLRIRTFLCEFEHWTIAAVLCVPNSILFGCGYSKTRCLPRFAASSQRTRCSAASSLFTLAVRPSGGAWPGRQACSEVTGWATLPSCCCSAQKETEF